MTSSGTDGRGRGRKRKGKAAATGTPEITARRPRGGVGIKNLLPPTFVRVVSPTGVPSGTPVEVDGEPGALVTDEAGELEAGLHEFWLETAAGTFLRRERCPSGRTKADPVVILLTPVTGAALASSRGARPARIAPPEVQSRGGSDRLTVAAGATPEAQTVVYIHGLGNKPEASILKCQWDTALFGRPLGDRSRMAYWVDRQRYPEPEQATCVSPDIVPRTLTDSRIRRLGTAADLGAADLADPRVEALLLDEVEALADGPGEAQTLLRIAWAMRRKAATKSEGPSTKVFPGFLRPPLSWALTRAFLADVHDFLFVPERRQRMLGSLALRLNGGGGPFVVIAHSQGSMIAYELLRRLSKAQCDVKLFVTIGTPLGLEEVKDALIAWDEVNGLKVPDCVDRWVNVADRLDVVALDPAIGDEYRANARSVKVEDVVRIGINEDSPLQPHSGTGYLRCRPVRDAVRETVGPAFAQAVGQAVIARNLTDDLEDRAAYELHRTLIELSDKPGTNGAPQSLDLVAERLETWIEAMAQRRPEGVEPKPNIDRLRRFIAADLTRQEIELLRTDFAELRVERVWQNARKRALIRDSADTLQAWTAQQGYRASGRGVGWAVLDTGIAAGHPHFGRHKNIKAQWDCLRPGRPRLVEPGDKDFDRLDRNGHGTHVAGIIAGRLDDLPAAPGSVEEPVSLIGMAPETQLYGFKVLDDDGNGHDSSIIKALDKVAELNERASRLVIHGVNLSLGGSFDPSVYGCGHTPLCSELRRLWRQGVLVCLAAGNEGYAVLASESGALPTNIDLSIGDPANLEEAIAVGSVHKRNPHTYGISYFSSRGPTADGRRKPDCVAPGEQILSAFFDYPDGDAPPTVETHYVEMSGTSMAAPHVSGLLAGFLSVKREFQGYPDKVRTILLDTCTDLGRDPYMQGAGLPNLVRMLASV